MTTWFPDTCSCKIEFDKDIKFVKYITRCKEHNTLDGDTLLNTVISHNQSFNLKYGSIELSKQQIDNIEADKQAERTRISQL